MRSKCLYRKRRTSVCWLAGCLLLAGVWDAAVLSVSAASRPTVQSSSQIAAAKNAAQPASAAGSRSVILILVDQFKGEDITAATSSFSTLFSERGGAGFMHTMPQRAFQQQDFFKQPLQLDHQGVSLLADQIEQAGIDVHRLPQTAMYVQDGLFPGGQRLDTELITNDIARRMQSTVNGRGQLFVVQFNQLAEVEAAVRQLTENQYRTYRQAAISTLDRLTQQLVRLSGPSTLVVLTATEQAPADVHDQQAARIQQSTVNQTVVRNAQKQLLPLFVAGGDIPAHSFLSSASTRRPGILTSADAATSLLKFFHVRQLDGVIAQTMYGTGSSADVPKGLQAMWQQIGATYKLRPTVLTVYGVFSALLLAMMAATARFWPTGAGSFATKMVSILMWFATAILTVPLVLLAFPLNSVLTGGVWVAVATGSVAAITFTLLRVSNLHTRVGILAVLYLMLVIGDCLCGAQLAHQSILSYDPLVGIRFYGVGNEYMGVVVGWFLLGCGSLYSWWPQGTTIYKWLLPMLGIGLALFFAWPTYGANAGGAVTAGFVAAVTAVYLFKPGRLTAIVIGSLLTAAPIVVMVTIHRYSAQPTHITMADGLLLSGNYQQLQTFILRKLEMNFRLAASYTSGVFPLASLGALLSVAMRPNMVVSSFLMRNKAFAVFMRTAVWAAAVAFATNDSGIVAAAMILLPVLCVTCMFMLAEAVPMPDTVVPTDASLLDTPEFLLGTDQGR